MAGVPLFFGPIEARKVKDSAYPAKRCGILTYHANERKGEIEYGIVARKRYTSLGRPGRTDHPGHIRRERLSEHHLRDLRRTPGRRRLVVADNYFDKTRKKPPERGLGAILFRDKAGKAYQVKGSLEYHREGAVFDFMKSWNPPKHPGHAAAALRVEEVYSGAEKIAEETNQR
jgi:hypothetical protein